MYGLTLFCYLTVARLIVHAGFNVKLINLSHSESSLYQNIKILVILELFAVIFLDTKGFWSPSGQFLTHAC